MARFWGPHSPHGLAAAAIVCALDQGVKVWLLGPFDIAARQPVRVTSFFDLVLVWNRGVSYGLFQQDSTTGTLVLLGVAAAACVVLTLWLASTRARYAGIAIGAIIGGALGNAIDRVNHGAVADFFSFHAFGFHWYVFNLADVAIVAGVAVVLYDSFVRQRP